MNSAIKTAIISIIMLTQTISIGTFGILAEINGDQPSGTEWHINTITIAENEAINVSKLVINSTLNLKNCRITINGDIILNGNLSADNSNLVVKGNVIANATQIFNAFELKNNSALTIIGDIFVYGYFNAIDSSLAVKGNITVEKNALLEFEDVNFLMETTADYEFGIFVNGSALIRNSILKVKNVFDFAITIRNNAVFETKNTEYQNVSLITYANYTKIENCEIYYAYWGIKLFSSFNEVKNSIIGWNDYAIYMESSDNNTFTGNEIHSNDNIIYINNSFGNIFEKSSFISTKGFLVYNSVLSIKNSKITNNQFDFNTTNATLILRNTTFNETRSIFNNTTIEFGNYISFKVVDTSGVPIQGGEVRVKNGSQEIFANYTNEQGTTEIIYCIYYYKNSTTDLTNRVNFLNYSTIAKKGESSKSMNFDVSSSKEISITLDLILPKIAIKEPSANSYFNASSVFLNGTASDNTNISNVQISFDNSNWMNTNLKYIQNIQNEAFWTWNLTVNLTIGTNKIYVNATDIYGNYNTTYIIAVLDSTKPILSALNISEITDISAKISWQTDEETNATVAYGKESKNYIFFDKNIEFKKEHSLTITAEVGLLPNTTYYFRVKSYDRAGNFAYSNEFSFTTKEVDDVGVPFITNQTPKDKIVQKEVNISAEYTDYSGIDRESIKLFIDEKEVANGTNSNATITDNKIIYNAINLTEGKHIVRLEIGDNKGNKANISWEFELAYPDVEKPFVFVKSHKNGDVLNVKEIKLKGNASDNKAIRGVFISLDGKNWTEVAITGNNTHKNWEEKVNLKDGKNLIYIKAVDFSNNENITTIEINFKTEVQPRDNTAIWIGLIVIIALVFLVYVFMRKR